LWLLGLAFIAMVFGSLQAKDAGLAGPHWLLITYVVYTWGELCLSPVGLAMVTRLAPAHLQSLMMGVWWFTFSLANLLAGLAARYSVLLERGEVHFVLDGLAGFYLLLVVVPVGIGLLILALTPLLKRWMHGAH
jgi:POT family proton-dependent oligopeptide transporter